MSIYEILDVLLEDIPVKRTLEILTSKNSRWMMWEIKTDGDQTTWISDRTKLILNGQEITGSADEKMRGVDKGMTIKTSRSAMGGTTVEISDDEAFNASGHHGGDFIINIFPPVVRTYGIERVKQFIKQLSEIDPTGLQGAYIPYIAKQVSMGHENIILDIDNFEDADQLRNTLAWFYNNREKAGWEGPTDINQYKSWHDLAALYIKAGQKDLASKTEEDRKFWGSHRDDAKLVYEITVPNTWKSEFRMYLMMEPEAMPIYGGSSEWCTTMLYNGSRANYRDETTMFDYFKVNKENPKNTSPIFTYPAWHPKAGQKRALEWMTRPPSSNPNTATEGYPLRALYYFLRQRQFLIMCKSNFPDDEEITYANGYVQKRPKLSDRTPLPPGHLFMPFVQLEEDGTQINDPSNHGMSIASPAFDYVMAKWSYEDPDAPLRAIAQMRRAFDSNKSRPEDEKYRNYKGKLPIKEPKSRQ